MRKDRLFLLLFVFSFHVSRADVRLPAVIASNMVLQQRTETKLWGWADPGERIYVTTSWNQRVDSARGTRDGKWELVLPTPAAGGPYTIEIKGYNRILLENILIGEVWVCSGQSNMEMSETWGLPDVRAELPACTNSNIRFFHVPRTTSAYPQDDVKANWEACDSATLKRFSAVGYFFGKRLNKELNVPVGLVEVAWSGSPGEVWTPGDLVHGDTSLRSAAARQVPRDGWPYMPGYCYNGMVSPLTSFAVAGAVWYQGESNTVWPSTYSKLLSTMVASWRKAWNRPLSFYYVQIAPFKYEIKDQASLLREQQEKVMSLEHSGMVVVSDLVDDTADIHPKDKHDVGYRLANWALADTYHRKDIIYKNPVYQGMEVQKDKAILSFSEDLEVRIKAPRYPTVRRAVEVKELWIAGEDRVFYPATAEVRGNKMTVSAKAVTKPVAVRYQFSNSGIGNLFGKQGLPVAPFRTDDWNVF